MGSFPIWPRKGSTQCRGKTVYKPEKAFLPQAETLEAYSGKKPGREGKGKTKSDSLGISTCSFCVGAQNTKDPNY